jgi:hypothetical protein
MRLGVVVRRASVASYRSDPDMRAGGVLRDAMNDLDHGRRASFHRVLVSSSAFLLLGLVLLAIVGVFVGAMWVIISTH